MPASLHTSSSSFSPNGDALHPTPDEKAYGRHSSMDDKSTHVVAPFTQPAWHERASERLSAALAAPSGHTGLHNTLSNEESARSESLDSSRKRRRDQAPPGPKAQIPQRRSSVPIRRKGQDLISFHRQSCRMFLSLEGTLATSQEKRGETDRPSLTYGSASNDFPVSQSVVKTENGFAYLTSTPSSSHYGFPRHSRRNSSAPAPPPMQYPYCDGPSISNTTSSSLSSLACVSTSILNGKKTPTRSATPPRPPLPVSVLSWTSAQSRRLEYEEIDRSHSGLRGLWKRTMPRWCHGRHSRTAFFDGKSSDAGSVRRYRIDLDDDQAGDDEKLTTAENENLTRKNMIKKARMWSCLSLPQ